MLDSPPRRHSMSPSATPVDRARAFELTQQLDSRSRAFSDGARASKSFRHLFSHESPARPRRQVCDDVARIISGHVPRDQNAVYRDRITKMRRQPLCGQVAQRGIAAAQWAADDFSMRCLRASEGRLNDRLKRADEIRSYRPYRPPSPQPLRLPAIMRPQKWDDVCRRRNRLCEECAGDVGGEGKGPVAGAKPAVVVVCSYCSAVAHARCASAAPPPAKWVCGACRECLSSDRREAVVLTAAHEEVVAQHRSATRLQAAARRCLVRVPYARMRRRVVVVQGVVRVQILARRFRARYVNDERPYRVTVAAATLPKAAPDDDAQYQCVVSVVPDGGDGAAGGAAYQFATKPQPRDGRAVNFHETFLVPATACSFTVFATLVSRRKEPSAKAADADAAAGVYSPFPTCLGQAVWPLEANLLYYRRLASEHALSSPLVHEPREKTASGLPLAMKMHHLDASAGAARIRLEVAPCPRLTTHFGAVDEVTSLFNRRAVKRRLWALLVDSNLHFYADKQQPEPAFTWKLGGVQLKVHGGLVLELRQADRTVLLSTGDDGTRAAWFAAIRKNVKKGERRRSTIAQTPHALRPAAE
ncbi:hypothetical protein M885DRAFT_624382 [Pelagophyceae sp. CCMP2097]|nr:hypothetical protein M885DRAFT_624382 [Pelagophyceae sp. CCMP2097]